MREATLSARVVKEVLAKLHLAPKGGRAYHSVLRAIHLMHFNLITQKRVAGHDDFNVLRTCSANSGSVGKTRNPAKVSSKVGADCTVIRG